MIITGQLLVEEVGNRCRLVPGYVRIDDDVIAEVVEGTIAEGADLGGHDCLITPGFVDTHLHLPQFEIIGAHGMPLLKWLHEVTFPAEMKWGDTEYARAMTRRVIAELKSVGTTAIAAYATAHFEATLAAIEVAGAAGMRGVIGQTLINREAPEPLCFEEARLVDQTHELLSQFPPDARMSAAVTPRFAVSCTPTLLEQCGEIARQTGAVVQTHLAETVAECELVKRTFPDSKNYTSVYDDAGLLGPRTVLGHGIHLCEDERQRLKRSQSMIAHCPTANTFLRSGTMPRRHWIEEGLGITLGSDIGAGYERSMVRVARAMIEAASTIDDGYPDAATAWHTITTGNARAMGWHDVGQLKAGASADVLVIRPEIDWQEGLVDPLSKLMFAWDDRWIRQLVLRGVVESLS